MAAKPLNSNSPDRLVGRMGRLLVVALLIAAATASAAWANLDTRPESVSFVEPRIGDHGTYELHVAGVDAPVTVVLEWLAPRQGFDAAGGIHTVRPLAETWSLPEGDVVAQVLYDEDQRPLARAMTWASPFQTPVLGVGTGPTVEGNVNGRIEVAGGAAHCGFTHSAFGRELAFGSSMRVFGGCVEGSTEAVAEVTGPAESHGRQVIRVELTTQELSIDYIPGLSMPWRVESEISGLPGSGHGTAIYQLVSFRPGNATYTAVSAPVLGEPYPLSLSGHTAWTLDDTDVDHPFPLREAYATALNPLYYAPTDSQHVDEYLNDHGDAYLAYAWNAQAVDEAGFIHDGWAMVWTNGYERLAKFVSQSSSFGLPVVGGAPLQRTVAAWDPPEIPEDVRGLFPPPERLPARLPTAASALTRASQVLQASGEPDANSYGFIVRCTTEACRSASAVVYAGTTQFAGAPFAVPVQDQQGRTLVFGFAPDGQLEQTLAVQAEQRAPYPLLPAATPVPASTAFQGGSDSVNVPEAIAAASGLALLAALLYYAWPTLKGGAVALFSRIEPDMVLRNARRARVMNLIEQSPGVHFQELLRRTGSGRGNLEHHLEKLRANGKITLVQADGYLCYFPSGKVDRRLMEAAPVLRSKGSKAVLIAWSRSPGATARQVGSMLGMAPSTVHHHLKRLRQRGLIEARDGHFYASDLGLKALQGAMDAPVLTHSR